MFSGGDPVNGKSLTNDVIKTFVLMSAPGLGLLSILGCGGGGGDDLPPLPGKDGNVDRTQDDAQQADDGGVGEEAGVGDDAGVDALPPDAIGDEDAGQADAALSEDAAASDGGVPDSPVADAATTDTYVGDAPVPVDGGADGQAQGASFFCMATAEDRYGMKYATYFESKSPTVQVGGDWSGDMQFQATNGTLQTLINARRSERAATWPQDGQTIPAYANNLTATYFARFTKTGSGTAIFRLDSYPYNLPTAANATVLPITWADAMGLPMTIDPSTYNEVYATSLPALEMGVSCLIDPACQHFQGQVAKNDANWPITNQPDFATLNIKCDKI